MNFRCRDTGAILTQQQVKRTRCSDAFRRILDDKGNPASRSLILVFPDTTEGWTSSKFCDAAAIDPIHQDEKPESELGIIWVLSSEIYKTENGWRQGWTRRIRWNSAASWKAEMQDRIRRIASRRRDGPISIHGVKVKTDPSSLMMAIAADTGIDRAWVSGNTGVRMTGIQVHEIRKAIEAHIQACFDREAELLNEVNSAEVISEIDIGEGWPDVG
jgi:hypothetical protein